MAASLPNFPPFSVHEGNAENRWGKWISRLENLFIGLDLSTQHLDLIIELYPHNIHIFMNMII
jgi:hypothetical protein